MTAERAELRKIANREWMQLKAVFGDTHKAIVMGKFIAEFAQIVDNEDILNVLWIARVAVLKANNDALAEQEAAESN